ncbi:MAG TPA: hypothetical protein PLJ60_13335 [Chryseolinea sp.]|nr:hypothetical protein [Chryseolinea sp.]
MDRFTRAWDNRNSCIVHIRELPKSRNGAKCGCICVECNSPLEALQGDKNDWSFRHQSNTICKGGPMTALHILAQELLCGDKTVKTKRGEVPYLNATKEWPIPRSRFKADLAGIKADGFQFLIEIFVTHKLKDEDEKVKFIQENKLHSIEIDLSRVDPEIGRDDLLKLLLTDMAKQTIIYAPSKNQDEIIESSSKEIKKGNWYDELIPLAIIAGVCVTIYKCITGSNRRRKR